MKNRNVVKYGKTALINTHRSNEGEVSWSKLQMRCDEEGKEEEERGRKILDREENFESHVSNQGNDYFQRQ